MSKRKRKTIAQERAEAYCRGYREGWFLRPQLEAVRKNMAPLLEEGCPVAYDPAMIQTPDQVEKEYLELFK